ncbi:annexin ANXC4 [Phlyctema vagabunda]|uniref:Annexin ANXC4 n=1 Tax=Phlyctema vagabunda TaxID=108571 RepID=A0ABR4PAE2_9HELO
MSLDPRDSHRRGRSKSPGRERSRSRVDEHERSRTRVVERAPSPPSRQYEDDYSSEEDRRKSTRYEPQDYRDPRDSRERLADPRDPRDPRYATTSQYQPSAMPGAFVEDDARSVKYEGARREKDYYKEDANRYEKREPARYSEAETYKYEMEVKARERLRDPEVQREINKRERERMYEEGKKSRERGTSFHISGGLSVGNNDNGRTSRSPSPSPARFSSSSKTDHLAYGKLPPDLVKGASASSSSSYAQPKQWEYAPTDEKITYSQRNDREKKYAGRPESPPRQYYSGERPSHSRHGSYAGDSAPPPSKTQIVTVEPGSRHRRSPSPSGLAPRMHSLSVSTGHHGSTTLSLANAPGSPLLEAYQGTYQSISPMPSPLMIASASYGDHQILDSISPLTSDDERGGRGKKKRSARFHDPEEEASILAKALKGEKRAPDTGPLIEILPSLSHTQVMELRVQYKKLVKTGDSRGVNIAKHIKMRLKEEDPLLLKACYVCALGRWESEAYWANFWYQGEKSRRELLIESLMGRTNREIHEIKEGFADKKYSNSLSKCMRTELKEDKFKKAVLLVLEEKRAEDRSDYDVDRDQVADDVRKLHSAVKAEKGGETAMINIIVVRSDAHIREILRLYETTYRTNFAREMLKKSGNLVGETLAHILNGVINKPVRDALLLHHALSPSRADNLRAELLISRLVRYHWDRPHFEAVKREYRARYGVEVQRAVAEGTRGEWGRFCEQLCMRRMADEVKYVAGR